VANVSDKVLLFPGTTHVDVFIDSARSQIATSRGAVARESVSVDYRPKMEESWARQVRQERELVHRDYLRRLVSQREQLDRQVTRVKREAPVALDAMPTGAAYGFGAGLVAHLVTPKTATPESRSIATVLVGLLGALFGFHAEMHRRAKGHDQQLSALEEEHSRLEGRIADAAEPRP